MQARGLSGLKLTQLSTYTHTEDEDAAADDTANRGAERAVLQNKSENKAHTLSL